MLYIIYAESLNYCGYGQYFVVEAEAEEEARELADNTIEEFFFEQDSEQLEEDDNTEGPYSSIQSIEVLNESHEHWQYYKDPEQSIHYIEVG